MPPADSTHGDPVTSIPPVHSHNPPHRPWIIIVGVLLVLVGSAGAFSLMRGDDTQKEAPRTEPLRIGVLQNVKHLDQVIDGFKQGLSELGYQEGVDVVYEYNNANGDPAAAKAIAEEYVRTDVDLMLTITEQVSKIAWNASEAAGKQIPIVFTNGLGMVETGFLDSYASSGTYVTGVVPDDVDVTIKKLEFLKEINPAAKRVGVFFSSAAKIYPAEVTLAALREQAPKLGLELVEYDIKTPPTPASEEAMQKIADGIEVGDIDAIVTIPEVVANYKDNPKILIELSRRIKAPVLFLTVPRVFEGGLLSYSQDYIVFGKQAAAQADKIFRGTPPSEIPIEFSEKNLLIINLKTAKDLGLTIPESLLFKADRVVPAE